METIKFQHRPDGDIDAAYFFNENEDVKNNVMRIIREANAEISKIRLQTETYIVGLICQDLGISLVEKEKMSEEGIYLALSEKERKRVYSVYERGEYLHLERKKRAELEASARYVVYNISDDDSGKVYIDIQTGERVILSNSHIKSIKIYDAPGAWGGLSDDRYLAYYSFNPQNP